MGTEYPEGGIIVAHWGQETSSVYSVCSVVLYPQHIRAGGHHGTTEYTEYTEGGIIVAHWGVRNIVCVFCVFSGPLSATHSGWGAPRHHGIPGMAYPYEGGITCLSNHGTTEYTEYPPVWARKVVVNGLS